MLLGSIAWGTTLKYTEVHDIPYKESEEAYVKERCKLDIYYPEDTDGMPCCRMVSRRRTDTRQQVFPLETERKGHGACRRQLPFASQSGNQRMP